MDVVGHHTERIRRFRRRGHLRREQQSEERHRDDDRNERDGKRAPCWEPTARREQGGDRDEPGGGVHGREVRPVRVEPEGGPDEHEPSQRERKGHDRGRAGDLQRRARDGRRGDEQTGRENETPDERNDRRVHVPEERGASGARDRGSDAARVLPRDRERPGGQAEPNEHHAELSRAGRLRPEAKSAREGDLRAVRCACLGDEEQGRQRDERERASRVRSSPRACAPHRGDAGGEEDQCRDEHEGSGKGRIQIDERHRSESRTQYEVGAEGDG